MASNNLYLCYYLVAKCAVSELSTSSYCGIPETDDEGTVVGKYLRFEKTKEFIGIVFLFLFLRPSLKVRPRYMFRAPNRRERRCSNVVDFVSVNAAVVKYDPES